MLTKLIVLLSCYVCFEFLTQIPDTENEKTPRSLGKAFKTKNQKSEISWIMRKPCINPDAQSDLEGRADAKSNPIFRSEDFRSTLSIGWIPDSGLDFFTLFILDLHKKWRVLFEKADSHLVESVSSCPRSMTGIGNNFMTTAQDTSTEQGKDRRFHR